MRWRDRQGRLFGRLNLIDAAALLLCFMVVSVLVTLGVTIHREGWAPHTPSESRNAMMTDKTQFTILQHRLDWLVCREQTETIFGVVHGWRRRHQECP